MIPRNRRSTGLNLALLLPVLLAAVLLQVVVPLSRVATSYRALELELPLLQIGLLSSAFALLPILFSLHIGRYNDLRGEGATALAGSAVVVIAVFGLWLLSSGFLPMMVFTCILGVGHVMLVSALQMMTTRCSTPDQHDRVLGHFLVATALGQILGPMAISLTTPAGAQYPDSSLYWILASSALGLGACSRLIRAGLPRHVPHSDSPGFQAASVVRIPGLLALIVASGLAVATNDLIIVFFPVLAAANGINAGMVGLLLSVRALASMASRLLFSRLVDAIGKVRLMTLALLATAVATATLALDMPIWGVGLALAGSGFSMGLAIACSISLSLALAPASGKATAMSIRLTANRLAQFLLPLGAGASAVIVGPGGIFALSGLCLMACGALVARVRQRV
ncbi:MFS transporter [Aminobacter sp. AP02]|uniref:MFS transporter n=1 Tax=Aminobacter sp. AP02 TaxID=2135737 RepID=UPI000D6C3A97|nr:MFS transporter [Aminobacter sp. AP02]PWK60330.1 putative MFS family arabinose efflux permease [Aminobacter sp. AP02]